MRSETGTYGMTGMVLGAVAASLGIAVALGDAVPVPVLFALCALGAGLAMGQAGRRPARSRFLAVPKRPSASAGPEAPEACGADLLGHEIKNYLCTLKGNARLLRQRMPSDDQAILDRIDHVVEKLEAFTRSLAGAGEAAIASGALSPMRPSQAAQACAHTHFPKRTGAFRYSEDPCEPSLLCDPGRFEQVFLNLYANALEAGAGRIDTSVRRENGRLIVRIEDDGHGCAPEDIMRIFEPFYTTKPGPARRGLGMFIVRSIVENHGGRIGVATKNGGPDGRTGLVFTLEFPASSQTGPLQGRGSPARNAHAERTAPSMAAPAPAAAERWASAAAPGPYQEAL